MPDVRTEGQAHRLAQQTMTVGELARITGLTVKAIREYEGLGLIYSCGRSEAGYRLFDESALWCAAMIRELRGLGLTIDEITGVAAIYLERREEPIGPHIASALDTATRRLDEHIRELERMRARIDAFRHEHSDALAGTPGADFGSSDPHRMTKQP